MNNNISKKNIFIFMITFIIEILLIYLIINNILTKDLISPHEITFYEYLKCKLSNII